MVKKDVQSMISLRIDAATLERLSNVAEKMTKRAGGAHVTRAGALRAAIDRGLITLEREMRR